VLLLAVSLAGALMFRDGLWFAPPSALRYSAVVLVGVALQIVVEWVMVHVLDRWGYAPSQPVLPVIGVGILPVVQPIVLLPLVFGMTARWEGKP